MTNVRTGRLASALFLGTVLLGCPKKEEPPAPPPAPKADIEPDAGVADWPGWPLPAGQTVTASVLCRAFFSPSADLKDSCARKYDPTESTRTYLAASVADCAPRLERSLINGRVELNQAMAAKCIDALLAYRRSGRTDPAGTEWEHACDGVLTGKTPATGTCKEEWDCAAGLGCQIPRGGKQGKCTQPSELNGLCTASDLHMVPPHACAAGLYCAADTCRARDKEGSDGCGPYSCIEGTFCGTGSHRCLKQLGAAGTACLRHDDCAQGFYCDVKKCTPQKSTGAKCLDSVECKGDCEKSTCVARCNSG